MSDASAPGPAVVDSSLIFFGVLVCALAYLAINPITLPCVGCDEGGLFYKCMPGTGLNSVTCEAWTKGAKGMSAVRDQLMSISEYSSELVKFSSHLPQYLYDFAGAMLQHIRRASAEVYARLKDVAVIAKQKMLEVLGSLKAIALDTWATVFDRVIKPVMSALTKYVLQPITALLDKIIQFAKMVIDGVTNVIGRAGDIMGKAYNAVHHAADVMSDTIELVMRKSAQIIEQVVDGLRNGINKGLHEVVGAAESTINSVSNAVGDALGGMESAVNATVGGTTGAIETGVNTIGGGITTAISGLEKGINTGISGVTDAAQKAVTGVTSGVEQTVNTLGAGVAGGLDAVLTETETIVNDLGNVVESSVNDIVGLLNKGLVNPIESTINSSSDIIENALAGIMVPVRSMTDGLNKLGGVRINLGPIFDAKPFSFLSQVAVPNNPQIAHIDLKDIPTIKINDVNVPGVKYVKPKGALGGRQRLQAAINRAEKNWQVALGQAVSRDRCPYKTSNDANATELQSLGKKGGISLGVYTQVVPEKRDFGFLPPMGSNAQAAVSHMRQGTVLQPSVPQQTNTAAPAAVGGKATSHAAPAPPSVAVGAAAAPPAASDILIQGVAIPPVNIPAAPTVKIDTPNLTVKLNVPKILIPKPKANPVSLTAPTVQFDVEIDSKIPRVPNLVDGISQGISALGDLLGKFFKPVWSAFGVLQGIISSTIAMIVHFWKEEVRWANVVNGVTYALKRGWEGVKEVGRLVYKEVIVPVVNVLYFLRDKIVFLVHEFATLAMGFLGNIFQGLRELGHNVWTKRACGKCDAYNAVEHAMQVLLQAISFPNNFNMNIAA
ncbi:hypothetical protein JKP88DRAFT_244979 [Tribonema minus]|uniref:Uncharacterized protein n=1 Tax=Tribonema minus TaxID=303371 RepID=A0A835Z888_9STRA|nr:hypothetical protein JKP88DRAFT_244979 [Tribonema minus]